MTSGHPCYEGGDNRCLSWTSTLETRELRGRHAGVEHPREKSCPVSLPHQGQRAVEGGTWRVSHRGKKPTQKRKSLGVCFLSNASWLWALRWNTRFLCSPTTWPLQVLQEAAVLLSLGLQSEIDFQQAGLWLGMRTGMGFFLVPTVSPTWLMGLGFKCFILRAFTLQVRSRPHCTVRVSLSTELFPGAMTTGWKFPLPSTSSLGTGVPSAEAANLQYEAWLSAVTSSTLGLTSTLT